MSTPSLRLLSASASLTAGLVLAGCSSSGDGGSSSAPAKTSSPAASSASATAPSSAAASATGTADYKSLVIAPSDIPVPGFSLAGTQAAPGGKGITALFITAGGARQVSDILVVAPNAADAKAALSAAATSAGTAVADAKVSTLDAGDGGKLFEGTTGGGAKATTVAVFSQGNTFVTMDFESAASDPIPAAVVTAVAKAQAAKIAANPPR